MEEIDIWWEGPFSVSDIIDNKINHEESENIQKDIGLYQVYSSHPLYGNNVLVYIGLTTDSFKIRLKNRWVTEDGNDPKNVTIYLGCIFSPTKELDSETQVDKIKKAEALLINILKPAFNSSNIQSVHYKYTSQNYFINNLNSYKNIYPQLSSKHFWNNRFKNFEITDAIAKELEIDVIEENEFYGFQLKNNDNICLGVDYVYWNKENIPLVLGIYKDCNMSKKKLLNTFKTVGEDKEYYFVSACSDLSKDNAIDEIKEKIELVIKTYKN